MPAFKGLTSDAFAAYTPEKWASNVHNLARMRVKDALMALCDQVQADLAEEIKGLSRAASDDEVARKNLASFLEKTPLDEHKLFDIAPQDKHLAVVVILRQTELFVGLWCSAGAVVDRRNFSAMLHKAWEREQLLELVNGLPDGATLGGPGAPVPAMEITVDALADLADHLGVDAPAWQIGHSVPATEAIDFGVELAEYVGRWVGELLPIYRFIAWDKTNDHIDVNKQLQQEKAEKKRQALGFGPGDKVRIISGVFTGKQGVVQDVDAKAQVRVRVGKMSVVVSGNDLTPAS